MNNDKYSSDAPVHSVSQDKFSRWAFAERIAGVISERKDPSSITIGLYGPWGDGKTSVLNFIEESIKKNSAVIVIRFNPWLFGNVESLLLGFFDVLAEALDTKLITKGEKLKDILKKAAPGVTAIGGMKGLGDAVGSFLHSPDVLQLRNRIESELANSNKRVLVMIDDVDRLEKSEIQAVFKLVKLVADFKFTAYLLAFDKEIVASSLSESYSGTNEKAGEQFLEKIIQIPLHLPAVPDKDLRDFCFQGVDEALKTSEITLSEQQVQEFVRDFTHAFQENLTTPRKAKLYGNILMFSLPILKGEVNTVDLMLLEGLRVFTPELYEVICKNKESFVGTFRDSTHQNAEPEKTRIREIINSALKRAGVKESSGYIELLKNIFPKIQSVYGNMHYGNEWYQSWNDGQRLCADGYFDRYFTYSIPKGDFPDVAVSVFLNDIDSITNLSSENNPLNTVLTPDNAGVLIRKLRNKASSLNSVQSASLALAISLLGAKYPNPESMFGWDDPHTQAAMLVSDLFQNIDKTERVSHVISCISHTPSTAFQLEIYKWLKKEDKDKPEKDAFIEKEIDKIGVEFSKCLEAYISKIDDITTEAPRIASHIFYLLDKYSSNNVISHHINKVLEKDGSAIVRLLDLYTNTAWGMETGISHKSDFERDAYNGIIRIFDPEFILDAIKKHLGDLPENQENFPHDYENTDRSIIAHQFVWIHSHVLLEISEKEA